MISTPEATRRSHGPGPVGPLGLCTGFLLLAGGAAFVAHEVEAAHRLLALGIEDAPKDHRELGLGFDLRVLFISESPFAFLFLLLHIWVLWAAVVLIRQGVEQRSRGTLLIVGMGLAVIAIGHAIAVWLTARGPSVGLPY